MRVFVKFLILGPFLGVDLYTIAAYMRGNTVSPFTS